MLKVQTLLIDRKHVYAPWTLWGSTAGRLQMISIQVLSLDGLRIDETFSRIKSIGRWQGCLLVYSYEPNNLLLSRVLMCSLMLRWILDDSLNTCLFANLLKELVVKCFRLTLSCSSMSLPYSSSLTNGQMKATDHFIINLLGNRIVAAFGFQSSRRAEPVNWNKTNYS